MTVILEHGQYSSVVLTKKYIDMSFLNIAAHSAVILNQKLTRNHFLVYFVIIFIMNLRFEKETWVYRPALPESCSYCFKVLIDTW